MVFKQFDDINSTVVYRYHAFEHLNLPQCDVFGSPLKIKACCNSIILL